MSENSKSKVVGAVTEFLSCIIIGTEKEQLSSNFYYRGESEEFLRRVPTFYRADYGEVLVEKGSEYYYRLLISELGYIDYNDSFSLFQLLSELQHYEGKTRMLDVSSNPLVALFLQQLTPMMMDMFIYLGKRSIKKNLIVEIVV